MMWWGGANFKFYITLYLCRENKYRKEKGMGLEKFALEAVEHVRLSEELLAPLWKLAGKFEDFLYKSPWKNAVTKIAKNGNSVQVGDAGAKAIVSKTGDLLVHRKLTGISELPNGSPALKYTISRPNGRTYLYVRPNLNGTFSPVRL